MGGLRKDQVVTGRRDREQSVGCEIPNGIGSRYGRFAKMPGAQRASGMHSIGSCLSMMLFYRSGPVVILSALETMARRCYNRCKSPCDERSS